ncbi:MAG: tetraacyldisaccharide 4'-kinase, partial [Cyclobacteriaceae bacterium]|nr:tetraacyldisaccharide 4'-kinase [Cyclobacteriaceae bacterium]
SGKTPMVEYLITLLSRTHRTVTLSRGYKRETQGYRIAGDGDTAHTVGDEPLQLYRKFGRDINVVVGEDRVFAIPNILQDLPGTEVIIMDDALQHRPVRPQLTILVTEFSNPFYSDFLMPFGRLREARKGATRADIIVVTKCDETVAQKEKDDMMRKIRRYAGEKPVFFSSIGYDNPRPIGKAAELTSNVIIVSGIAKTTSLNGFCQSNYQVVKHFKFPDHHRYTVADLTTIENFYRAQTQPVSIVTTEKDMVKLNDEQFRPWMDRLPWFYIPIRQVILEDGLKFDELVLKAVKATAETK